MRAVAGLGNPGRQYAGTRHNAGWMVLDRLAERGRILERRDKEWAELRKLKLGPDAVWLIRSTTYMNGSGLGVAQACRSLQLDPADVLLVYDDVDLPLGQLRLRRSGGSGGHRGLESVIESLGTTAFPRMRLGVRGLEPWRDTAGYVLEPFADDEAERVEEMLTRAVAAARMILRRGLGAAMNTYNQKTTPVQAESGESTGDQEQSA